MFFKLYYYFYENLCRYGPMKNHIRIWIVLIWIIMYPGSNTWTLSKEHKKKIDSFHVNLSVVLLIRWQKRLQINQWCDVSDHHLQPTQAWPRSEDEQRAYFITIRWVGCGQKKRRSNPYYVLKMIASNGSPSLAWGFV